MPTESDSRPVAEKTVDKMDPIFGELLARPTVVYHADCSDGYGAAWAAHQHLGDDADYVACAYGQLPDPTLVQGRPLYIVDFSFPRDVLIGLATMAQFVVVLDHHKSAKEDLESLVGTVGNLSIQFDMLRSGAMMTWDYFFPEVDPPRMIAYIQDRDLWSKELPGCDDVAAGIASYAFNMSNYPWNTDGGRAVIDDLAIGGANIRRYAVMHASRIALNATILNLPMDDGAHEIPHCNCPKIWASDVAGYLAQYFPFAVVYWDEGTSRCFSARSVAPHGTDVSAIARTMGGGGHRHAAGWEIQNFNAGYPFPLFLKEFNSKKLQ